MIKTASAVKNMQLSKQGADMIRTFEGFREVAYKDVAGVWTVGYGETQLDGRPVREGDRLTRDGAAARFDARIAQTFGPAVTAALGPEVFAAPWFGQAQFDACVSLAYNIGTAGFAGSTLCRLARAGMRAATAEQFTVWNKAGGVINASILARRTREMRVFLVGYLA